VFSELFHPKVKSDLKKLDKKVAAEIRDVHLDRIINDPTASPFLRGKLSHIRTYHFRHNSIEYRIAYEIKNDEIIFYYMIASRENFYKKLEKRAGQ
jgi:addiction module RelE/StbE family toxin